jgi:hypothetical protein
MRGLLQNLNGAGVYLVMAVVVVVVVVGGGWCNEDKDYDNYGYAPYLPASIFKSLLSYY